ncbi:exosortase K [Hymenobacter sp. GOD-10R]|uniref:exosortase K n=1 Tax=Hymenobacter sp. GOD-10R TaxID=3093922 RepID=UPI002D76CBD9|nr:exosortase K [Hymenobacter sp. GOD-10R]WRQ30563.1 exosortase K [Hymenobacter sp. GOD-10R]
MKQRPLWPYYVGLAIGFALLKAVYVHTTSTDLLILLAPTNYLVEIALGSASVFDAAAGFMHPDLHISIDKSCSGYNFWLLCWLLLSATAVQQRLYPRLLMPMLVLMPFVSYVLTLLVNTSRILTAVFLRGLLPPAIQQFSWLHQAEGALLYLFFLVLIYLGFISSCSYFQARHAHAA